MTTPAAPEVFSHIRHEVVWRPTRPNFSIQTVKASSTSRGYHETRYEVVSRQPIAHEHFQQLVDMGLFGIGQAWHIEFTDTLTDVVPAVTVDRVTGKTLDIPPKSYGGQTITSTNTYDYHRYVLLRICDSGD